MNALMYDEGNVSLYVLLQEPSLEGSSSGSAHKEDSKQAPDKPQVYSQPRLALNTHHLSQEVVGILVLCSRRVDHCL